MNFLSNLRTINAINLLVSTFGVLVGFAGIEHGIFEVLQGNTPIDGLRIDAIGPEQKFWLGASETALTIIPNFLLTGIVAICLGILVVVWSIRFTHRKYGASVLFILTITLFLVGGGFAPIFVSIFAWVMATQIGKPLDWWLNNLPGRNFLAKLWPGSLITFVIVFTLAVGMQIFGAPIEVETTTNLVQSLAVLMLLLIPVSIITAIPYQITQTGSFDTSKL